MPTQPYDSTYAGRFGPVREALAAIDVTRVSHVAVREPAPATADSLVPLPVVDPEAVRRALAAGDTLAEACTLLRYTCDRAVAERRRRPSVWHDVRSVALGVAVGVVASSLLR